MDDIARTAEIGRATLYLLFSGKEEIALAVADRRHERLLMVVRHAAMTENTSCAERLRGMMLARILSAFDAIHAAGKPDYEMLAAIRAEYMERRIVYMDNEAHLFKEVIAEGVQSGELVERDDASLVALALVQATNALMPFSLSVWQLQNGRDEVIRQAGAISQLLLYGLLSRKSLNLSSEGE